ncbi:MAG: hypothetical protein IPP15_00265 [Saprospiraceae bacterium]|uniref:Sortilin N-terminal domain-containing protein n=1 Tax=Candidatus Opimibacter skivensis TaxID=2982028 RepID=A0A9D7STR9_9BACT|nr:hypothetical protein [Candidatus Opimibacter skivensis]
MDLLLYLKPRSCIVRKPDDPDFILAGTTTPRASVDGGLTWEQIIAGHDLRSFNYDPHRPGKVYVTSDFGVATIEVAPLLHFRLIKNIAVILYCTRRKSTMEIMGLPEYKPFRVTRILVVDTSGI